MSENKELVRMFVLTQDEENEQFRATPCMMKNVTIYMGKVG
jgi:hypothetical protein